MFAVFINAISVLVLGFFGAKAGNHFSDRLKNRVSVRKNLFRSSSGTNSWGSFILFVFSKSY